MIKCDQRAKAKCPFKKPCCGDEAAYFVEGSECDKFNQKVLSQRPTNAARIRAMSDEELADFMTRRNVTESCLRLADEGYMPTEEQKQVLYDSLYPVWMEWLQQPAEGEWRV